MGGTFTNLGGLTRTNIGRLNNTSPATESLTFDGSSVTWLRGGSGPEVGRASFESTTNGLDWMFLGNASRISGGWQAIGLSVPVNATIRARSYVTSGIYNGSAGFVETFAGFPAITSHPASLTNIADSTAVFNVTAIGTQQLMYQWRKGNLPLQDGGNVSGTKSPTLILSSVLGADAGEYSVVVTNSFGSVTSRVAVLTVLDPFITLQPVSQAITPGQSVMFVTASTGTTLQYQWYKDGAVMVGATAASLEITNAQGSNAGLYAVVVSNNFGCVPVPSRC